MPSCAPSGSSRACRRPSIGSAGALRRPADRAASRNPRASSMKYSPDSPSARGGRREGLRPGAAAGAPRRRISSVRRLRTTLQSPRFSVKAHTSRSRPPLIRWMPAPAASRELGPWLARFFGQHHQELAAAAGAEQDPRQAQFRQQRARQHLAEQRHPLRAADEQGFGVGALDPRRGGGREKLLNPEQLCLQEDLNGHQGLDRRNHSLYHTGGPPWWHPAVAQPLGCGKRQHSLKAVPPHINRSA